MTSQKNTSGIKTFSIYKTVAMKSLGEENRFPKKFKKTD